MSKRQTLGYKSQLLGLDLSYLGWTLLAALPQFVYNFSLVNMAARDYLSPSFGAVMSSLPADYASFLPLWAWMLVIGLWLMAVSPFFRPVYLCTELGYFETAKRTSGVGAGISPLQTPARSEEHTV